MKTKSLIISILFVCLAFIANAQQHNEQITVEGSYRPQIKRSERLVKMPETPENKFNIPEYKAETKDFNYGYNMEFETMSAVSYKADYGVEEKSNFLKAGLGTRLSPLFLFRHYSDLSRTMSIGVGVKHYSSWLNLDDYKKSSFMNNNFNVMTVNKFKGGQLRSFVNYKYDMYHLRADVDNDNGRNIHSVNAGAKWLANGSSYRNLYSEVGGDVRSTWITGATQENQLNAKAHLAYSDNWINNKNVDNLQTAAADFEMNYNNIYQGQMLFAVNPYFTMNGSFYHLHAGIRLDFKEGDVMGLYPDVMGSVFVLDNMLEFYAKFGGRSKINTFAGIVAENPFVTTNFTQFSEFGYEKTRLDFQAGVKSKLANNIDAHFGVRYRNVKNSVFYVPDKDFYATYDDDVTVYHLQAFGLSIMDCNVVNVLADLRWKAMDKLNLAAELSVNSYSLKNNALYKHVWYKPSFTMNIRGDYEFDETWTFNASMMMMGKRWALNLNDEEVTLDPAFDIQLGADYQIQEDLAAFVEIHNLFHQKYQFYYNYPSLGFEIFVGLKYRF
ncbi:MAG: TonB-dependent receptor [Bacteroidales bacterium]|nr:TonB-dependent receptor [Bacteroidales bacterium]